MPQPPRAIPAHTQKVDVFLYFWSFNRFSGREFFCHLCIEMEEVTVILFSLALTTSHPPQWCGRGHRQGDFCPLKEGAGKEPLNDFEPRSDAMCLEPCHRKNNPGGIELNREKDTESRNMR